MIYISCETSKKKITRWIAAGQTVTEALFDLTKYRIIIGAETVIEKDLYVEECVTVGNHVFLGDTTHIGAHSELADYAVIAPNVFIGKHCVIESDTIVGRYCKIGEFSVISSYSELYDNVSLPPHTIGGFKQKIKKPEKLTAVIATDKKVESFLGSEAIFVYDSTPDPSLENDISFADFFKEARILRLSKVLEKQDKELKVVEISKLLTVLQNVAATKKLLS